MLHDASAQCEWGGEFVSASRTETQSAFSRSFLRSELEVPFRACRVEYGLRRDRRLDVEQRAAHRLGEALAEGSRHHPASDLDEEFVPEVLSKPRKRSAHRGLREMQPFTGEGDIALPPESGSMYRGQCDRSQGVSALR